MNYEMEFKKATGIDFNQFYNDYKPKLKWHLSNYTGDLLVAEDFAHEAIIQGLQKLHQFDSSKSQIQTWVFSIAKNLVIREYKEKQKMPSISLDKEFDDENTTMMNFLPCDDEDRTEAELIAQIKHEMILNTIQNLPSKYKEVIMMRELEHMQYKEIADKLGRNLSTIKSQIRKGRQLIIDEVEKKFKNLEENGL